MDPESSLTSETFRPHKLQFGVVGVFIEKESIFGVAVIIMASLSYLDPPSVFVQT